MEVADRVPSATLLSTLTVSNSLPSLLFAAAKTKAAEHWFGRLGNKISRCSKRSSHALRFLFLTLLFLRCHNATPCFFDELGPVAIEFQAPSLDHRKTMVHSK